MIVVKAGRALGNYNMGKNATFKEGNLYFFRHSKSGLKLVVRSEEGYWLALHPKYRWYLSVEGFKTEYTIYMKNRKRLNEIPNAQEYVDGDNIKKLWCIGYHDVNLYSK